jgi:rhamnopyranosyl-N-acetylglucosaminyl-diphospho-decaprenol beta-1,3/1,4-galactofuranosyltransferase
MKVSAVIVTHNRKDLLRECLEALLSQTRPLDEIIVIDNASMDGTVSMVRSGFPEVTYVGLPDNIGGAGGFHEGMRIAYEKSYDWIWVMDDDGVPDEDCLKRLMECAYRYQIKVLSPLVINQSDDENFRFIPVDEKYKKYMELKCKEIKVQFPEVFPYGLSIFHGLLISSDVINKIGFPKRELFIWGEEYDYIYRAKDMYVCGTCTNATFKHPSPGIKYKKVLGGILGSAMIISNARFYYFLRNKVYIYKKHFSKMKALDFALKQSFKYLFHSIETRDFNKGLIVIKAIWHGFQEKWVKY